MRCEDYPCCGHTSLDPCETQPYDRPGYYDTSIPGNEHALCNHAEGECNVDDEWDDEDEPDEPTVLSVATMTNSELIEQLLAHRSGTDDLNYLDYLESAVADRGLEIPHE